MLNKLAEIYAIKAFRLLQKFANVQATQRYERLLSWFAKFAPFYKNEFLMSERLVELQEDEPQIYYRVKSIFDRVEDVAGNLASFMAAVEKKDKTGAGQFAGQINQQASNINEEIDYLLKNSDYEDIFEYEGTNIEELLGNFLVEVAQIALAKNTELNVYVDTIHMGPVDNTPEPEDDSIGGVHRQETKLINAPESGAIFDPDDEGTATHIREIVEDAAKKGRNTNVEDRGVERQMYDILQRRERAKLYRWKNKTSPEYRQRQAERDAERAKDDARKATVNKAVGKYQLKLKTTQARIKELQQAYGTYLELIKNHKALTTLRETNRKAYDELHGKYLDYKRLLENKESFDSAAKQITVLNKQLEARRKNSRDRRQREKAKRQEAKKPNPL